MNRRGFLRLMGLGAAAAVAGPVLPKHAPVAPGVVGDYKGWTILIDNEPYTFQPTTGAVEEVLLFRENGIWAMSATGRRFHA